ncbi:hypothetical protein HHI36_011854 [Cryptolaemus montrouzieri]|uniref:Uncharacterized protein n=1 Tax=Cryptolaemus montrouzieri TaxID=559131 RepID=A0ABD2NCZ7_9CUCU
MQRIYVLLHRLIGYDEVAVNTQYSGIHKYITSIQHRTRSHNARKCMDYNLHIAQTISSSFKFDSTCLLKRLNEMGVVLLAIIRNFIPENNSPNMECPIPILCGITRTNLSTLMVTIRSLGSMATNGIKLLYYAVTFSSTLELCRTDMTRLAKSYNNLVLNTQMCALVA